MKSFIYACMLVAALCVRGRAQSTQTAEGLKEYVPVLPAVRLRFFDIDPKMGYAVQDVGGGVYVVSDNGWQSAFLVTDAGVIVFDSPESFGKSLPTAIAKITDKPIKMLIYSHIHRDHIGGSMAFKDIKGLEIVALKSVAEFLKEMNDPERLVPTVTFESKKTIRLGGKTVELTRRSYHSSEGPRRGGVIGENLSPSALQLASSKSASLFANSSSSLHFARSTDQVTDLPSIEPLFAVTVFGRVIRNWSRISPFFFCASSKPGTWKEAISPSGLN